MNTPATDANVSAHKTLENWRNYLVLHSYLRNIEIVRSTPIGAIAAPQMESNLYNDIIQYMESAQA